MNFRKLFIIPLGLLALAGCEENANENNDTATTGNEGIEQPAPGAQQQAPGTQQPGMQQQAPGAQNISDEELETFVEIDMQLRPIQREAQQEMVSIVEEEGMDVEKYQEIARSQQQQQSPQQPGIEQPQTNQDFSESEMEKFEKINESLSDVEAQMQQDAQEKIEEEGLTFQRYQELAMAVNQSPELQQRLQEIFRDKMGGQQQGQQNMQPAPGQ